jgi:hypothetical protein
MGFSEDMVARLQRMRQGQFQDPANPDDPNQQSNWAIGKQEEIGSQGLYDPNQMAMIMKMLGPYFQQQTQNLNQAQDRSLGQATRGAGAYAASQGYDNPFSMIQRARGGVYNAFAPQYGQLQENQLGMGLNAAAQNQQFRYGNAQNLSGLWNQRFMKNEESKNQPTFWENLGSGLITGGLGAAFGPLGLGVGAGIGAGITGGRR